jgi:hypothetical protein
MSALCVLRLMYLSADTQGAAVHAAFFHVKDNEELKGPR